MSAVVTAALALGLALYVLHPLAGRRAEPFPRTDDRDAEARRSVRAALLRLRDLERDRNTGVLDEEDYRAMRAVLAAEVRRPPGSAPPGSG